MVSVNQKISALTVGHQVDPQNDEIDPELRAELYENNIQANEPETQKEEQFQTIKRRMHIPFIIISCKTK